MNNGSQQSLLARLLSKENISVQHGKYQTAFFDIKNRMLGLPIWKDTSKDVYDLLVGHEVGHALYTPRDALDGKLPCRKDYLNIVEDVRIEKMIRATYPGLVGSFRRGYSSLSDRDFFGIKGKDSQKLAIGDRVNLKSKLDSQIDLTFSAEEQKVYDRVMAVQTWDDVVAAAIELQNLAQAQAEQEQKNGEKAKPAKTEQTGDESQDPSSQEASTETKPDDLKNGEEPNSTDGNSNSAEDKESDGDSSSDDDANDSAPKPTNNEEKSSDVIKDDQQFDPNSHGSVPEITTNSNFEKAAADLVDNGRTIASTIYAVVPSKEQLADMVISYKKIVESRKQIQDKRIQMYGQKSVSEHGEEFTEFLASTKKFVSVLTKEFEMRKAAYQYSRSTVSQTGVLNVNKLHSYKCTDDIFLSVAQLANAKNHGMMMFVDYSSSMASVLPYVLKHIINLSVFCKSVGIPFQVYGFTGSNNSRPYLNRNDQSRNFKDGEIVTDDVVILDLVSSSMPKAEYQNALKALFSQTTSYFAVSKYEQLGNTPLNETIIAAHDLVKTFKSKNNIEKMTTVFLTDGEGQHPYTFLREEYIENRIKGYNNLEQSYSLMLNGRKVNAKRGTELTYKLIENLGITTGTKTIGFFIPSNNKTAARNAVLALESKKVANNISNILWKDKLESEYKKNKSICIEKAFGYDQYFIVGSGKDLEIEEEDLEITSDMTRSKMAKAFSEFSKNKQINRVFVSEFAQAIA